LGGSVIAAASDPPFTTESLLRPWLALQAARQGHSNCKAGHVYSRHDIVGDLQACIKGLFTVGIAALYPHSGTG
jgi:hypothetical protein